MQWGIWCRKFQWLKWIDGNLHVGVEVRVDVGMENQIVDRRPYNAQNKDQTEQKVGQRKRGKNKRPSTTN